VSPPAFRRSPLVVLFLTVFIDLMGFGIVIPLLPAYAERLHHATPSVAGALVGVYSLMQLVFAPIWGVVSDRLGRRTVILVSLAGSTVSYLLLGVAWSIGMLFLARILAGVAGANIPVAQAYVADVTPVSERARGMGLIGAAFGLGMVIGPALGAGLTLVGPRVPEFFAAGLCLANLGLAAVLLPESLPEGRRRPRQFKHPLSPGSLRAAAAPPGAPVLFAIYFLATLGFSVLYGTFPFAAGGLLKSWAKIRGSPEPAYTYIHSCINGLWAYMGLVAVVVQGGLLGRLARRVSEVALVRAGTVGLALGLAWIPFAGGPVALLLALGLVASGQGLAGPPLSSLVSQTAPGETYGEVLGVSQSLSAAARALGPTGGGLVLERLGAPAAYVCAALCSVGALGFALSLARRAADDHATRASLGLRRWG